MKPKKRISIVEICETSIVRFNIFDTYIKQRYKILKEKEKALEKREQFIKKKEEKLEEKEKQLEKERLAFLKEKTEFEKQKQTKSVDMTSGLSPLTELNKENIYQTFKI